MSTDGEDRPPFRPDHFLVNLAARGMIGLALALPYGWRVGFVGWLMRRVIGPFAGYSARARENLALIWPDRPQAERDAIAEASLDNAGRTLIENYSTRAFLARARAIEPEGPGYAALIAARNDKRPVILVSGHFGNYEAARAALVARGFDIGGLYRNLSNRYFNAHYVRTMQAFGGPITRDQTGVETYAVIFTIAPSLQDGNTIWTGSDDGWAHVTRDGAKTWEKVTPPDLPEFARISLIEASPHQNGVAYLAANRYQLGDRRPYLYKTADFGRSWTSITSGIPADDFLRTVREDPKRRGLLYAGTEHGVYVSFNDGASWQSLRLNLPDTPVHGIVVEERDLVIGTHGRGFYVLDNIGVLRQATPEISTANLHVFNTFTPLRGRDRNVTVDYYLGRAADEVKIEFLDGAGTVLRSFTGTPKDDPNAGLPPGVDPDMAAFFGMGRSRVGVATGMNRFTWDMRYEGAVVFPGMIMWAAQPQRGPAAPPGKYAARITANGETKTMAFEIGLDPRLGADGITVEDLREQFALSAKIRDKVTEANQAVITIRALRDQVNERMQKIPPRRKAEIQKLADSLLTTLATVEAQVYQVKNRSSQDPLNYPIMLNNKIAALAGVVESADHKPTTQSYDVFTELSQALDAQLGTMKKTLDADLPRLNNALRREKLAPVDPAAKPSTPAAPPAGARPPA